MSAMAKLQSCDGLGDGHHKKTSSWLDTHPAETERIEALKVQAQSGPELSIALVPEVDGPSRWKCASKKRSLWQAMGMVKKNDFDP